MYQKTDELVDRVCAMTIVKEVTAVVTRRKLMGLGALGVTGMAAAAVASLVRPYWADIWRTLRGG